MYLKSSQIGGLCLVILVLLQVQVSSVSSIALVQVILNRVLPWFEEESFAESFYLNSRISLLSLTSPLQANTNDTILRLSTLDGLTTITNNVSDRSKSSCASHLQYILTKLWTNQRDASLLSFIDSFAKPVPGIRNGNLNWHGNQMQCESSIISLKFDSEYPSKFGGKYCKAEWGTKFGSGHVLKHFTGVCLPDSCSGKDFEYMKSFLEKFFFLKISEQSFVEEISCIGEEILGIDYTLFCSTCIGLIFLGIFVTAFHQSNGRISKIEEKQSSDTESSILSIFSIPLNLQSLDGRLVSKDEIFIIHYFRGIAAIQVVLSHNVAALVTIFIQDPTIFKIFVSQSSICWLVPRTFMTIFFFLSGFLINPDFSNTGRSFNPIKYILKIFLRLSPSHYLSVFAHASFISTIGLGKELDFGGVLLHRNHCKRVLWDNLLYFQNLSTITDCCNAVTWSLAATFQLCIVGVSVVWLIMRSSFIGLIWAILLIVYGLFSSFETLREAPIDNLMGLNDNPMDMDYLRDYKRNVEFFLDKFYIQTSPWLSSVIMGILFAYFLPKIQRASHPLQEKIVKITSVLIMIFFSIFVFLACLKQSHLTYSLLQTFSPIGMGLIMSLLIFIFHPQSRFIDYKLSSETCPILVHFSRLSYPLYLTHWTVLVFILNTTPITPMMDKFSAICVIVGCLVIVYFVSILLYILVERPIQNIRKICSL
ncbi:uncharacterized protein LOC141850302 [Brevipalpus obovatus]|uniref:uncharacterized protein LOC141850302 n=1 Tax=Brevipalpus obovatus TaxID=246614 RepID=UPI003D9DD188